MARWGITCIVVGLLFLFGGLDFLAWLAIIPGILFVLLGALTGFKDL